MRSNKKGVKKNQKKNRFIARVNVMKPENHLQIIVHAKTIQTRVCCESIKMLDTLNRKDDN